MVSMPTQRNDVLSGLIGNRFVGIILVELDGIWNCQWNVERVIVSQTVIFQRVSGLSGSRNIHDRIDSQLVLWNKGSYDKLVQDPQRAEVEALGNKCGTQTQEQRHITFQTFFLKRNFANPFVLLARGRQVGCCQTKRQQKKRVLRIKPQWRYCWGNIHPRKKPWYYIGSIQANACFVPVGIIE